MSMHIRKIAELAGVSVATVSRCLNQPEKVSPKTREHILSIIKEAGYIPNPSAQSLSTGQTRTIACLVPTLRNEFFNQLVEGAQEVLRNENYKLLVYSQRYTGSILEKVDQRSIDGIIISGSDLTKYDIYEFCNIQLPYIVIENVDHAWHIENPPYTVYIEDYDGVQMALSHLYNEGNRCFGIIGGADQTIVTQRRFQSVVDFFQGKGDCTYYLEYSDYSDYQQSLAACRSLMNKDKRPTAIFAFNDMMAAGALRFLLNQSILVPEEVEVIGFDDIPLARFFTPSLSTVAAPNRMLGEKAAELLLARLAGKEVPERIMYPVELKLRESTKNTPMPT